MHLEKQAQEKLIPVDTDSKSGAYCPKTELTRTIFCSAMWNRRQMVKEWQWAHFNVQSQIPDGSKEDEQEWVNELDVTSYKG